MVRGMRTSIVLVCAGLVVMGCANGPSAPAPAVNTAPTVTLSFAGASTCAPTPTRACQVSVLATVADAQGGPFTYQWSGCASGASAMAPCVVDKLGPVSASVVVTDSQGLSGTAQTAFTVTNEPPQFTVNPNYFWVAPSGGSVEFYGLVHDPNEGNLWGSSYCVSVAAAGACDRPVLRCPSSGPELIALRAASSGTCELTVQVKDSWNAVGTSVVTFDINNPGGFVISPKGTP